MKRFTAAKAIIIYQGKVLILQDAVRGLWGLPGGRAQKDESLQETLIREVREETGLTVAPPSQPFEKITWQARIGGEDCTVEGSVYICEVETSKVTLCDENKSYAWIVPEEDNYPLFDEITDALSDYLESVRQKAPS